MGQVIVEEPELPEEAALSFGKECYVEVLVYITGGFMNTGHADIAVTSIENGITTSTVYGKHTSGNGNASIDGTTHRRQSLAEYVKSEWGGKHRVRICQRKTECDIVKNVKQYLESQWSVSAHDYNALDANCSHYVGYVLKKFALLENWHGENEMNDDDFKYPEGDLHDDWLVKDGKWLCTGEGYLSEKAGRTLFDSWQATAPTAKPPAGSSGSSGGSSGSS